jgi:hypothetical protein
MPLTATTLLAVTVCTARKAVRGDRMPFWSSNLVWLQAVHIQFARDASGPKWASRIVASRPNVDFPIRNRGNGKLYGVSGDIRTYLRTVPQITC